MHTYIHKHIHTYIHTYIHIFIRSMGMRVELLRALGEWVHAVEEAKQYSGRLVASAKAEHGIQVNV